MQSGCAPLPVIIRAHPGDTELNLASRTLGDKLVVHLSEVINDLPGLDRVNLRNNGLTDVGLGKFISTLSAQNHITSVDISENKLDNDSSRALSVYLKHSKCSLRELKLSSAELDNDEVTLFTEALKQNTSLQALYLSRNMLGGVSENKTGKTLSGGGHLVMAVFWGRMICFAIVTYN